MQLYYYDGPVESFNKIISNKWSGKTRAVSKKKAKANLEYRFKKEYGFLPNIKITLPGEIKIIE